MKSEKVFVADAYTAFVMHLIASEIPIPRPESTQQVKVFFPRFYLEHKKVTWRKTLLSLMAPARIEVEEIRSDPSKYVMLFRPSMLDSDFDGNLPSGSRCLYSRWSGYLEQKEWQITKSKLAEANGDLFEVHTSGHIYADDIKTLVGAIKAKTVIPIHTFEAEKFSDFTPNVKLLNDGDAFQI